MISSIWDSIFGCCCRKDDGLDENPLSASSKPTSGGHDNPALVDDFNDNFGKKSKLQFHSGKKVDWANNSGEFADIDLGDGAQGVKDDTESGYGISLHDSLGSGSLQPSVTVATIPTESEVSN